MLQRKILTALRKPSRGRLITGVAAAALALVALTTVIALKLLVPADDEPNVLRKEGFDFNALE